MTHEELINRLVKELTCSMVITKHKRIHSGYIMADDAYEIVTNILSLVAEVLPYPVFPKFKRIKDKEETIELTAWHNFYTVKKLLKGE